jgi:hypothetical protein
VNGNCQQKQKQGYFIHIVTGYRVVNVLYLSAMHMPIYHSVKVPKLRRVPV